ncbi:DNA-binding protein [Maritimibacter sp. DP07]|uniref:DNA-binding protein n=1 Tax=Maritimibacter harenae TaxID=2606218 RepID=A0A845M657_9RHOB|nr:helix-hairpin-helix domain-containing protein [Maritimibacter harenae]MZR11864.1 DNA-binding protein [Maritimibacter harenae]
MARNAETGLRENRQIAARLASFADLLDAQGADGFRPRAYRAAADRIAGLEEPVRDLHARGGPAALIALPDIGQGIAGAVVEMLTTGRWTQFDRLSGETSPEQLFATLPGVGPALAERFARTLDVETLENLEAALTDQDVRVRGLGPRRRAALLATLKARLEPIRRARGRRSVTDPPPVAMILEADALYRRKAQAGELRLIAPRRFNPMGTAWLPILHLKRGDWHFTLLYSNTALAHRLGRTNDWVVVFFHHGDQPEAQCTVVTETSGVLKGKRVVRGREDACARHYGIDEAVIADEA